MGTGWGQKQGALTAACCEQSWLFPLRNRGGRGGHCWTALVSWALLLGCGAGQLPRMEGAPQVTLELPGHPMPQAWTVTSPGIRDKTPEVMWAALDGLLVPAALPV